MKNKDLLVAEIREVINRKKGKKCSKCRIEIPENAKAFRRVTHCGTFAPGFYCSQECAQ